MRREIKFILSYISGVRLAKGKSVGFLQSGQSLEATGSILRIDGWLSLDRRLRSTASETPIKFQAIWGAFH